MTRHRPRKQPPRPRRDQRPPPVGQNGGAGRAATGAYAPPLEECPPPPRTPTTGWRNQVRDSVHVLDVSLLAG